MYLQLQNYSWFSIKNELQFNNILENKIIKRHDIISEYFESNQRVFITGIEIVVP